MGSGTFCGSAFQELHCGGGSPVCCTSSGDAGCYPAGTTCSSGCLGGGGGGKGFGGCDGLPTPPESQASREYDERLAKAFAGLAQAAYCGPIGYAPHSEALLSYDCEECADAGFQIADMLTVTRQDKPSKHPEKNRAFAYTARMLRTPGASWSVARDSRHDFFGCVVGLPGSMHKQQWRRNLQVKKRCAQMKAVRQGCPLCKMHEGFQAIWMALVDGDDGVVASLTKLGCGPGSGKFVYPTGQSLGASLATIAMLDLQWRGFRVGQSYVFNSPRTGNVWFSQMFRGKKLFEHDVPLFRVNNLKDPTTHLPSPDWNYRHAGAEVYYQPSWPDQKKKYVVCSIGNEEDHLCSRRYAFEDTVLHNSDHCRGLPFVQTAQGREHNICGWMDRCVNGAPGNSTSSGAKVVV